MKRFILIWPPIKSNDRYGIFSDSGSFLPPLGIGILAQVLLNNKFEVSILDCEILKIEHNEAVNRIIESKSQYVGISATTLTIHSSAKLAELIKKENKNIKIIIGGPHITAEPFETMKLFPQFDVGIIGEGEDTIVELLNTLENKQELERVNGLIIRKNREIKLTEKRKFIENLDRIPFPAWHLFPDITKYYKPPFFSFSDIPAASVILTRGCPETCTFCDRSVFGNICRTPSSDYILRMFRELYYEYGIKEIMIYDDTFVAFRKLVVELCEKLKHEKINLKWSCNGRIDFVTSNLLKAMKDAGCWQIAYGIESGSQRILDLMEKKISTEMIEKVLKLTREVGIKVKGYFIFGYPTETEEEIKKTIDFMLKLNCDDVHISLFTPFPNTKAYYMAKSIGKFNEDWSKMSFWNPIYVPSSLTEDKLNYYLKSAVKKFYLRPKVILSYLKMIKTKQHIYNLFRGIITFLKIYL